MNYSSYPSLDELIAENNSLKDRIIQKECEIINLKSCKNNYISYHKLEGNFEFSDNNNDYWSSKMKEYGVNSISEAMELMNIEAIENNDNSSIEGYVYYDENNTSNINFLNGENYNIYMLYDDYLERL